MIGLIKYVLGYGETAEKEAAQQKAAQQKAAQQKAAQQKAAQQKTAQQKAAAKELGKKVAKEAAEKAAAKELGKKVAKETAEKAAALNLAKDVATKLQGEEFTPDNIVELYTALGEEIKNRKIETLTEDQQNMLTNLKAAFEILDKAKGSDDQLTPEHVKKMEPKMLEKVQHFLKEVVNSFVNFVSLVTLGKEVKVFDTEDHKTKVRQNKDFGDLIKNARDAAKSNQRIA